MSAKQSDHTGAAVAKSGWRNVRIYWGDNTLKNFDSAFHYPLISKSAEGQYLNKELIVNPFQANQEKKDNPNEQAFFNWMVNSDGALDLPGLKEQVVYFDNPKFKLKAGVSQPPLKQEKEFLSNNLFMDPEGLEAVGSICDRVEQFVIIEVVMEGGAPISPSKLPKVDVWSFLQNHTIGGGPDSRASGSEVVIDDDSKAGWFHCLVSPENTKAGKAIQYIPQVDPDFKDYPQYAPVSIEGRLENTRSQITQIEKEIPLAIDTRYLGKGIVRYKIKLSVANELTPEDNMRRWKRTYEDKFGDSPESRTIETGCWLKVWARNAEFEWTDDAKITDALNNDCRDAMDRGDTPVSSGFPRTAKNHYWVRNRLFDAVENKPMYVGLYPGEVIYALNSIEPSFKKMLDKKKDSAKKQSSGETVAIDSEVDALDIPLGILLYLAILSGAVYFINRADGRSENSEESTEEERRKIVSKIFNAFQLDVVLAAYAVNGFREGADAAKTLAEVSSNSDKKALFKWVSKLFSVLKEISFGEKASAESSDDSNENVDWKKKLKESAGHELNNDGNWGVTGTFKPEGKKFRKVGALRPLGPWASASTFFGGGIGLDLGVKGAWSPDNGELAMEFSSGGDTKANLYGGFDVKANWTRVVDVLTEMAKEADEDSLLSVLEVIAQWTNVEATLQGDIAISGLADLKLKYIYDASDKPSIWNLFETESKESQKEGFQATKNMLGFLVKLVTPLHVQLSGFTLKYNLFDLVLADVKTDEWMLFPRGKFVGNSIGNSALREGVFSWARYEISSKARLIRSSGVIALGDTLEFGLNYKKLKEIPKDKVYAWRLIKYTPTVSMPFLVDKGIDFSGGSTMELNPTSNAAYDLFCENNENQVSTEAYPNALKTKVRFTAHLPKDTKKTVAEYQIDFSQASDTYLHFLKEFSKSAESDLGGIKLFPQVRMEGMTDRATERSVILKYPQLKSVDIIRPARISSNDSKVIFKCNVKHYNDNYIAFAFGDDQWSADEDLLYTASNGEVNRPSHWHLINIVADVTSSTGGSADSGTDRNNSRRVGDNIEFEIDLKNFDLKQLSNQVGSIDGSLEIYIKLSFVGAIDQSISIDALDKYTQDEFLFAGNADVEKRLILTETDIKALTSPVG